MEFMPYWKHGRSTCRNVIFKKIQQNNVIQKVGGPKKSWLELRPEGLGELVMGKGVLSREISLCKGLGVGTSWVHAPRIMNNKCPVSGA